MDHLAKKRDRFEQLMQQAELPAQMIDSFFSDGYIDKVVCGKNNREWTFYIVKSSLIPQNVYSSFCKMIQSRFSQIAKIHFVIEYAEQVDVEEMIKEYWSLFIAWAQRESAGINGWLSRAGLSWNAPTLTVALLDRNILELARKKDTASLIRTFFGRFFSLRPEVLFQINERRSEEVERFSRLIEEEERAAVQDLVAENDNRKQAASEPASSPNARLMYGYDIHDDAVPLEKIEDEEKKMTVQGSVFGLEEKALRNGNTLFQFMITDFTDSLSVKMFARSKDDVKVMKQLQNGKWLKLRGRIEYDKYMTEPELNLFPTDINEFPPPPERMDEAEVKRVEFHLHTSMSAMDGVTSIEHYIKTAAAWGHQAIAVTDHATIQSFPDANKAAKKYGLKMLYGVEANVVHDSVPIVMNPVDQELKDLTFIVFDVETTGLSVVHNKLIEIAGVKMQDGKVIDRFSTFVNPHERIPYNITQLTHITDDMVAGAPELTTAVPAFLEFVGDHVLVAHNARFDMGFMQAACGRLGLGEIRNPVLDTLEFARLLYPEMKNHRLNTLADKLKVSLENHHRAVDDAEALGHVLFHMIRDAVERRITRLSRLNDFVGQDLSNTRPFHCCIYALNATGKKNLFKLISLSHTEYFHKVARIPKSKLNEMREGLLIVSGCEKGEFFESVLNKSIEEAEEVARFYDVLEIQPLDCTRHLVEKGLVGHLDDLRDTNRRVIEIGRKLGKPVIATGNVHYLHPRDKICRDITIHGITGFNPLKDLKKPDVHLRTTREMLEEFDYLDEQTAYEVVVKNTIELAERFEPFEMFPRKGGPTDNGLFSPIIEGADEEIRTTCYETAKRMYGDPLPDIVEARLEKELLPIIKYGFSANYLISERLVRKSNEDGYLVGSRGSVGSSIVATMLGISEVNPLPPHYLCPKCMYNEWFTDGSVPSGFDLPDKACPNCGTKLKGEGQDIPFETFLGFNGSKVPDIDLNFSGDYQPIAHNYTKVLFGEKNVFRAGTIGTVAEKTAYGFVKKYVEDRQRSMRGAEITRLAAGCTGVKRSTGQHPGGIVVVPDYIDVEEITPVQYPADDTSSEWKTTHFDYHAFDENLLKLDILGHDDPTMMRMLQDLTGIDPQTIPMNDPKVMSIFSSTEALGVTEQQIRTPVATYGIPEMGTKFVRQMLKETGPSTFADLLQISGLSHGTGVWFGNAQELIRSQTCTIKTVIGCRDDIMLYLIYKAGMDMELAFKITESVRKGKGLKDEWIEDMKKHNVPLWYIDSCQRIEYMFPKAHAAAYVISAVRTAYYKVYHPIAYYATYFSVRADEFDVELLCNGYDAILRKLVEIEEKGFQASPKEKGMISILEMALEMTARGFHFKGIDLYRSAAEKFVIDGDGLIPPFSAIQGVGVNAARNIDVARKEGEFLSIEDFQTRTRSTKTIVEILNGMGCFRGLPESNQLSLF